MECSYTLGHAQPYFDTPEAYEAILPHEETRIEDPEYIPDLKAQALDSPHAANADLVLTLIAKEEVLFGVAADQDPEKFLAAHNGFLDARQDDLNQMLTPLKAQLVGRAATFLAAGSSAAYGQWSERLTERLAATVDVTVVDTLDEFMLSNEFNPYSRRIDITSFDLVMQAQPGKQTAAYWRFGRDFALAHEVMHGMFAAGTQEIEPNTYVVLRNGLNTQQWIADEEGELVEHQRGQILSESVLASFRETITGQPIISYSIGAAALHSMDSLAPGLRNQLVRAAFDGRGPGQAMAAVENLIGPYGVEWFDSLSGDCDSSLELQKLSEEFGQILPASMRADGRELFNHHLRKIVSAQPAHMQKAYDHLLAA